MPIDEGKHSKHFPRNDYLLGNLHFRQKALKALDDRLKTKEQTGEAWPELEETRPPSMPSTMTININEPNELTPSITTKEESN